MRLRSCTHFSPTCVCACATATALANLHLRLCLCACVCAPVSVHLRPRVESVSSSACVHVYLCGWHGTVTECVLRVCVWLRHAHAHFSLPSASPFSFPHSLACTLHNASLSVIGAAFGRTGSKGVVVPSPRFDGVNYQPHPWCFSLWCFSPTSLSLLVSP